MCCKTAATISLPWNVHQCVCDGSSSCKYPVQGLTLIYSLPQSVLVHGVLIFIQSKVMIYVVATTDGVGISAGAISTERKNKHAYCIERFYFSFFFTVFVSYWVLTLQVLLSLALIFLCVCASFFFFFYLNVFTGLLFLFVHIYINLYRSSQSLKCLKCNIHTETKKSAAHRFPTSVRVLCFFCFFFTVQLCFFFLGFWPFCLCAVMSSSFL